MEYPSASPQTMTCKTQQTTPLNGQRIDGVRAAEKRAYLRPPIDERMARERQGEAMENLEQEITNDIMHYKKFAKWNFRTTYALVSVAVLASIAATVLAIVDPGNRIWIPILTAIPAASILINNTFKFETRSRWHWRKTRKLEALFRQIRDEGLSRAEASRLKSKIDQEMDDEGTSFGPGFGADANEKPD